MAVYFRKNNLCKICWSFDEKTLNEITLDILLDRLPWVRIREKYNSKLPSGVKPLNDVNLSNHQKHSDGANLALKELVKQNEPISDGDALLKIFRERYKTTKDSKLLVQELFRQRLSNVQELQELLDRSIQEYQEREKELSLLEKNVMHDHILGLVENVDDIYADLQNTFLKDEKVQKGIGDHNITFNQVVVNDFEGSIKNMMSDVIDYLLKEFKDDPNKGKLLVTNIAKIADNRVTPLINRLLQTEEVVFKEIKWITGIKI